MLLVRSQQRYEPGSSFTLSSLRPTLWYSNERRMGSTIARANCSRPFCVFRTSVIMSSLHLLQSFFLPATVTQRQPFSHLEKQIHSSCNTPIPTVELTTAVDVVPPTITCKNLRLLRSISHHWVCQDSNPDRTD